MTKLDPIIHEFDTQEEADAYDRWFRDKVERALKSNEPTIPHDEVMREMRELLDSKRANAASRVER